MVFICLNYHIDIQMRLLKTDKKAVRSKPLNRIQLFQVINNITIISNI